MSKRPLLGIAQYQLLATILGTLNARGLHGGAVSLTTMNETFMQALAEDNPRFDREKFREWILRSRADEALELGDRQ